jgi:hypothetical protein
VPRLARAQLQWLVARVRRRWAGAGYRGWTGVGLVLLAGPTLVATPAAPALDAQLSAVTTTTAGAVGGNALPVFSPDLPAPVRLGPGYSALAASGMSATVVPPAGGPTAVGPVGADAESAPLVQPIRLTGGAGGIPTPVLQAYQRATEQTAVTDPGCRLRWSVLAGIGRVESNNGRDAAGITPEGTIRPSILGPVLDGSAGTAAIPDSDGGRLDGDPVWDRAVGPMQFLPSSWLATRVAGDPNNIGDASLAAARYLCSGGGNLADPGQLAGAVFAYNHSDAYVAIVLAWITAYDRAGPGGVPAAPLPSAPAPAPVVRPATAQPPSAANPPPALAASLPAPAPPQPAPAPSLSPAASQALSPSPTRTPAPSPSGPPTPTPSPSTAVPSSAPAPAKRAATITFSGSPESQFGFTTLRVQVTAAGESEPAPLAAHAVAFTDGTNTYRAGTDADGIAEVTLATPLAPGNHRVSVGLDPTDSYAGQSSTHLTVESTAGTVRGRELAFTDGSTGAIHASWDGAEGALDLDLPGLILAAARVTAMGISSDDSDVVIAALDSTNRPLVVRIRTGGDVPATVSVYSGDTAIVPETAVTAGRISIRRHS